MEVEEQIRHTHAFYIMYTVYYNLYINIIIMYKLYNTCNNNNHNLPMPLNRCTHAQCTHSYMYVA